LINATTIKKYSVKPIFLELQYIAICCGGKLVVYYGKITEYLTAI